MNCRRAQSDIALWAGNDLDEAGLSCLQRHLEACPACRAYLAEMQALMRLVDECPLRDEGDEASKRAVDGSLWPSLCSRLVSLPSPRHDHFNGWVPAVAVAVVCLAMVLVASPPQLLSPQETPTYSVTSEEAWPVNQSAQEEPVLPVSPSRMERLPIEGTPVDRRDNPPVLFRYHAGERFGEGHPLQMLDGSSQFPRLDNGNFQLRFRPERIHAVGPNVYLTTE